MSDLLDKLRAPFPPEDIEWRPGAKNKDKSKCLALAYVDARAVQDRLDSVCGPEGWQDEVTIFGNTTLCRLGIKIGDEWVWKTDGSGETAVEAEKGAISKALVRVASKWGIGRYLYNTPPTWVEMDGNRIAAREHDKLRNVAARMAATTTPDPVADAVDAFIRNDLPTFQSADDLAEWMKGGLSDAFPTLKEGDPLYTRLRKVAGARWKALSQTKEAAE